MKKISRSIVSVLVTMVVCTTHAAVTTNLLVNFDGSISGNTYTLGADEVDTTGTFGGFGDPAIAAGEGDLTGGEKGFDIDPTSIGSLTDKHWIAEAVISFNSLADGVVMDVLGDNDMRLDGGAFDGLYWDGSTQPRAIGPAAETGTQYHLAMVWDPTATAMTYYMDGTYIGTTDGDVFAPSDASNISFGYFGRSGHEGRSIDGLLSAVAFATSTTTITTSDFLIVPAPVPASAPEWLASPFSLSTAYTDAAYSNSLAGLAVDPNGDPITYSKASGPDWLNVTTNGVLTGTPTILDEGITNVFMVVADDQITGASTGILEILVVEPFSTINSKMISMNFVDSTDETFTGGEMIGPLAVDSTYWNSAIDFDSGGFATGTKDGLLDDAGANTGTRMSWSSANTWRTSEDYTIDDEYKLSKGYLDDGGSGLSITVENIPYESYKVYGLFSSGVSDNGESMIGRDFLVNGTWAYGGESSTSADVNGSITVNQTVNGENWTKTVPGVVIGNYWVVETSGSTLSISGLNSGDGRGSLAGLIIEKLKGVEPVTDLAISGPVSGDQAIELSWTGESGATYTVETNSSLAFNGNWAAWTNGIPSDGGFITVTNSIGSDQLFYRVITED